MKGIAIGVLCSIIMLVRAISFPHDAILGRVESSREFHDLASGAGAASVPNVLIYRFSGPLFFANSTQFRSRVEDLIEQSREKINLVIVDCSAILFADLAGCEALIEVAQSLQSKHIKLTLATVHANLLESFRRGGVTDAVGESSIFPTIEAAVSLRISIPD